MLRKTLITTFDDRRDAERALRRLVAAGFAREELSLVPGDERSSRGHGPLDPASVEGANTGAAWGSFLGAVALLGGAVSMTSAPDVGLAAVVPLIAAALGAGAGGALGALVGAVVSSGVTEPEAHAAQEAVRRGKVLLSLHVELGALQRTKAILRGEGGVGVRSRAALREGHPHHA